MGAEMVSTPELARILGASERHLRNLVKKGVLSAVMECGHYRFPLDSAKWQYAEYEQAHGREVGYKLPDQKWWEGLSKQERELAKETDSYLADDWKNRVLVLRACNRVVNRLVDDAGNLKMDDGASIRELIENETLDLLESLVECDWDFPIFQNRYLCPMYGGNRSGNACPNSRKCFESSAFQMCFAASSKSDFIGLQGAGLRCCFCGEELPIIEGEWSYVDGCTPWPMVQDCGALCCSRCANEKNGQAPTN